VSQNVAAGSENCAGLTATFNAKFKVLNTEIFKIEKVLE
jgi:hypothetical protein